MRRFAKVLAAGMTFLAAPVVGLAAPAAALADPAVVLASIFSGGAAGVTTQTVTLGVLASCPTSDASPFTLNPSGATYQPAAGSSWSLDRILSCGLQIPSGSLTGVAVRSVQHGFEAPLSPSDLTDPTHYQDPTAPLALPVISVDAGQNQVTYARPERTAGDANGFDEVVNTGPVTIAVYENAAPLHVRITARRVGASATALRDQFTPTVTDASGAAVPAGALSFSWSFQDGSSTVATPTHGFPVSRSFVTVVIINHANGTGGTATIPVNVDSHALSGATDRAGAGKNRRSTSPSGAAHVRHTTPQASHTPAPVRTHPRPRSARARTSTGSRASPAALTTVTSTTTAPATTTASPATTAAASPHRAAARHRTVSARRRRPRRVPRAQSSTGGRLVRGLLIADVTPVAPAAGRLVRAAPAASSPGPVVRAATSATAPSGPIAAALIVVLLALGAGRELRGRRRWRDLRPGP